MKLAWTPRRLLNGRHARITLAHKAGRPGSGADYLEDLDMLDPKAWSLVVVEILDPRDDRAPKNFEAVDGALTKLLHAVESARTSLRDFADPGDAADALGLWEDAVAYSVDFDDEIAELQVAARDLHRQLESAADEAAQ